jgi:exodeoxyribonuclease-3
MLKIVSWNVNGYRSIVGQNPRKVGKKIEDNNILFEYIEQEKPDILCVQETKTEPSQLKEEFYAPPGYEAYYNWSKARKGYSGVVTFTKIKPGKVISEIGIERFDVEGRIMRTDFDGFTLLNIYFPNGSSGMHRVAYKLEFYDAIFEYTNELKRQGVPILMCGDYNTAHKEIDLANPELNQNTSGFLLEERAKIDWMIEHDWIDTFRVLTKEGGHYTWWDPKTFSRHRNIGWRIDYQFITEKLAGALINSYHQPEIKGSDHCPIVIELDL